MMTIKNLRSDILAGTVVFLVALPLSLGIAQACNLPPFVGLLTGVIGGLVVTLFSPAKFAVSGPAAGLVTVITSAMISLESFSLVLVALVLAGAMQIALAIIRAGRWIGLIPGSVIHGMMVAIGLQLLIQQIPTTLSIENEHHEVLFSPVAALVSVGALLILYLWQTPLITRAKWVSLMPGSLAAVIWGSLMVAVGELLMPQSFAMLQRIRLPELNSVQDLKQQFVHPDFANAWLNIDVWSVALTLALVASLETLLSQQALNKIKHQSPAPSPDQELRAQGIGNMISGFLGGLPITAVIVRSSVNVNAGAHSKLSVIWHGILLLVCGLFFEEILNAIPLASLAAVLIFTGYKLASPAQFIGQWHKGVSQFIPFVITVSGIVAFGMLTGLAIGVLAQLLCSILSSHRSAIQLSRYDDHYVVRFNQNLTFMHKLHLQRLLEKIPDDSVIITEHENAEYIDPDIKMILADFQHSAATKGIRIERWPI